MTGDGSKTLFHPIVGEHYHSKHGAVAESKHVFVAMGLRHFLTLHPAADTVSVLEIGFGTGLNFLMTMRFASDNDIAIRYTGVEAFPLSLEQIRQIDHAAFVPSSIWQAFISSYEEAQQHPVLFARHGNLEILVHKVEDLVWKKHYDVIYFDAFAAVHQPEMWTPGVLAHVVSALRPGGVFVTYAITGALKRTLRALGMQIEKVPGAPGKREMLRAVRR